MSCGAAIGVLGVEPQARTEALEPYQSGWDEFVIDSDALVSSGDGGGDREDGRVGSGGDGRSFDRDFSDGEELDLNRLAAEVAREARDLEPQVTRDLRDLADANDARLEDLDTKFKAEGSIRRKMGDRLRLNPQIAEGRLKRRIDDALRYTMVVATEDYAGAVRGALEGLRERGYEFSEKDVRNSWPEDLLYKGINCTLRTHGGTHVFEVQFHTDESLRAKQDAHPLYERRRSPETPLEERSELDARMRGLFGRISVPPEISDIGRVVTRE